MSGIQSWARTLCLVCMLSHFPSCSASLSSGLGFVSPQLQLTDCHSHRWREAFLPSAVNWSPFLWHPDFRKSMKTLIFLGATRDFSGFPFCTSNFYPLSLVFFLSPSILLSVSSSHLPPVFSKSVTLSFLHCLSLLSPDLIFFPALHAAVAYCNISHCAFRLTHSNHPNLYLHICVYGNDIQEA